VTGLHDSCRRKDSRKCVFFAPLPFSVWPLAFSAVSLVFMKGTSFCGIARILSRVEPLISWCAKMWCTLWCAKLCRSAWFPLLFACQLVEFDTCNLPCVYALFRLVSIQRYAFQSPQICFWGTKYEFYREHVAQLYYIVRRALLWLELFASTLGRFLSDIFHIPDGNDNLFSTS